MWRKGHEFKYARHLMFRRARPTDLNTAGEPHGDAVTHGAYVVPVRLKDCHAGHEVVWHEEWQKWLNIKPLYRGEVAEKAIPVDFSRTNMSYGKKRRKRWDSWTPGKYQTCPIYWMEDGYVYTATHHIREEVKA